jgi:electron transfer flavoprotein alpha subunit
MKAIVLAEKEKAARELCAGARSIYGEVALVALGDGQVVKGIADKVFRVTLPEDAPLDNAYETVIALVDAQGVTAILVEPTVRLKAVVGRIAARKSTSVICGVIALDAGVATNRYFGGLALKRQRCTADLAIYTVSPGVFSADETSGGDTVEDVAYLEPPQALSIKVVEPRQKSAVNLQDAKRIIAAGRGFTAEADLDMVRELGGLIGAELGCTRPLTEVETWLPRELYIGVSGLMLSPEVYVGIGLSGQMQHMVGVNSAKVIFAINKDKNAVIFKQADYGLVGDLYQVLPRINAALPSVL